MNDQIKFDNELRNAFGKMPQEHPPVDFSSKIMQQIRKKEAQRRKSIRFARFAAIAAAIICISGVALYYYDYLKNMLKAGETLLPVQKMIIEGHRLIDSTFGLLGSSMHSVFGMVGIAVLILLCIDLLFRKMMKKDNEYADVL